MRFLGRSVRRNWKEVTRRVSLMAPLAAALRLSVVFLLFVVVPTDSANRRKTHHHVARRKGDEAFT